LRKHIVKRRRKKRWKKRKGNGKKKRRKKKRRRRSPSLVQSLAQSHVQLQLHLEWCLADEEARLQCIADDEVHLLQVVVAVQEEQDARAKRALPGMVQSQNMLEVVPFVVVALVVVARSSAQEEFLMVVAIVVLRLALRASTNSATTTHGRSR